MLALLDSNKTYIWHQEKQNPSTADHYAGDINTYDWVNNPKLVLQKVLFLDISKSNEDFKNQIIQYWERPWTTSTCGQPSWKILTQILELVSIKASILLSKLSSENDWINLNWIPAHLYWNINKSMDQC